MAASASSADMQEFAAPLRGPEIAMSSPPPEGRGGAQSEEDRQRRSEEERLRTIEEGRQAEAVRRAKQDLADTVKDVQHQLQRMSEAEERVFRTNKEGQDLEKNINDAEVIATAAESNLTWAQCFVSHLSFETRRSAVVKEELAEIVREASVFVRQGCRRLKEFKNEIAMQKRTHYYQLAEAKIEAAETKLSQMKGAAAALACIGVPGDSVSASVRAAIEQSRACERDAQEAIFAARVQVGQASWRSGTDTPRDAELRMYQTRVLKLETEIKTMRAEIKLAKDRIAAKQNLADLAVQLQVDEAEIDRIASASVPAGQGKTPTFGDIERAERASNSARTKLSATARAIFVNMESATGFLLEELEGRYGYGRGNSGINRMGRSGLQIWG